MIETALSIAIPALAYFLGYRVGYNKAMRIIAEAIDRATAKLRNSCEPKSGGDLA